MKLYMCDMIRFCTYSTVCTADTNPAVFHTVNLGLSPRHTVQGGCAKKTGISESATDLSHSIDRSESAVFFKRTDLTEICMHGRLAGWRTSQQAVLRMLLQLTVTAHFS